MVPIHTVAFSQQKLRSALRRSGEREAGLTYGFVIHARRRGTRSALGIITLGGESLALTPRLVAGLSGQALRLFGSAPIALEPGSHLPGVGAERPDREDLPLSSVLMQVDGAQGAEAATTRRIVEVEATVMADSLVQPLVVLTTVRPGSWPS